MSPPEITPPAIDPIVDVDLAGDAPAISEEVDLVADATVLDSLELIPWEELVLPGETPRQTVRRLISEREHERQRALLGERFQNIRLQMEIDLAKYAYRDPEKAES